MLPPSEIPILWTMSSIVCNSRIVNRDFLVLWIFFIDLRANLRYHCLYREAVAILYKNLKGLRESLGLTQAEFGESVGVPKSTYNNYETGARDPGSDFWIAVAQKYGVTIDYLMGFSDSPCEIPETKARPLYLYSKEALAIASRYDSLTKQWKKIVDILLDAVIVQSNSENDPREGENKIIHLPEPIQAASAGTGEFADDDTCEQATVLYNKWTAKADYIMRVHGDSMEPQIHDGDRVLVREQPAVDLGETGVFIRGGERFAKIYRGDYLESANPTYPDVELDEDSRCIGKVIGVLDPNWVVER